MPVCNEIDVLEDVVEEWVRDVISHLPIGSELLFDEAASTDGTKELLQSLTLKYPYINVEYHTDKDGFANAARRLYGRAKCPWIFFTDSDGQYIASDFWKLAKHIDEKNDLIRGAKIGRRDPKVRRLASALFNKFVQFLFNLNYLDFNSAFFLVRKDALCAILPHLHCMPTLINTELLLRLELENYSIKQVYVLHRERKFGISRGLAPSQFIQESLKALRGLYAIKASYRTR